MSDTTAAILRDGREVRFSEISTVLARPHDQPALSRALTATVVAVGPAARLVDAAEALRGLGDTAALRAILISPGSMPAPPVRIAGNTIALAGVKPEYIDNAVAALRLSSLPTLVWWRGGLPEILDRLANLADRVVLDEEHPEAAWRRALSLLDRAAFSDLRWTRLTRWRALMAHFFDIPEVREVAPGFSRLRITGADPLAAHLFAGWLQSSLDLRDTLALELRESGRDAPIEEIRLGNHDQALTLRLAESRTCVMTSAVVHGHTGTRTVSLGDGSLTALIMEELRVRAHDRAFERALRACCAGPR